MLLSLIASFNVPAVVLGGLHNSFIYLSHNIMKTLLYPFVHGSNEDQEGNKIQVGLFKILKY